MKFETKQEEKDDDMLENIKVVRGFIYKRENDMGRDNGK